MPDRAHVSSVDALDAFRTALVLYISKARPTLEEVSAEVMRTRIWLENDQRVYWENQHRRRARNLEQAQQALFSARLSKLQEPTAAEVMAVQRAKRAIEEAEHKLRLVKQWNRDFDSRVQPMVKQLEKLHSVFSTDLPHAISELTELARILAAYAEVKPGGIENPPVATGDPLKTENENPNP